MSMKSTCAISKRNCVFSCSAMRIEVYRKRPFTARRNCGHRFPPGAPRLRPALSPLAAEPAN
jgi:hypothetical protein